MASSPVYTVLVRFLSKRKYQGCVDPGKLYAECGPGHLQLSISPPHLSNALVPLGWDTGGQDEAAEGHMGQNAPRTGAIPLRIRSTQACRKQER